MRPFFFPDFTLNFSPSTEDGPHSSPEEPPVPYLSAAGGYLVPPVAPPEPVTNKKKTRDMAPPSGKDTRQGFGNRAHLDKVDRLRALGISSTISLPQLVVVGDQSAGKSSVLESLTGFHFPRAVTLCTRHATEIICRREEKESIVVSIHPVEAGYDHEERARAFRRELTDLNGKEFADIFEEAAAVMGIGEEDSNGLAFSRDVLRVEINGPEEEHLTIIDVPGIFEHATPGITTDEDIDLVKDMVKAYIREPRTIILAVVPANVDIATQTILKYAADADPEGKRTLGVLTKPDLAIEVATKQAVVDLVRGKRRDLQLGYCVVRNRGADDKGSSPAERDRSERSFFAHAPWTVVDPDRLGIPALKSRLRDLLSDRTRSELPKMMREVKERLSDINAQLLAMGVARGTTDQQRAYLAAIAGRFDKLKNYALDTYYSGDGIFDSRPELKLVTRIREINEEFANLFYERAHMREFYVDGEEGEEGGSLIRDLFSKKDKGVKEEQKSGDGGPERNDLYKTLIPIPIPSDVDMELDGILSEPYACPRPLVVDIIAHIDELYRSSRGYELGTFGPSVVPTTFREQSQKWPALARAHVSNAILIVHHFIAALVRDACPDPVVRAELWSQLLEPLTAGYKAAMKHTEFLLRVERGGRATLTVNPDFLLKLSEIRTKRAKDALQEEMAANEKDFLVPVATVMRLMGCGGRNDSGSSKDDDRVEGPREQIHSVLSAFYTVSRARFVDTVCVQAVDHFLLSSEDSPLNVLGPEWVLGMSADQLNIIAGEDAVTRTRRERLEREVAGLKDGLAILKS